MTTGAAGALYVCTEAHNEHHRRLRAKRAAQRPEDNPLLWHGKVSTYKNHGCAARRAPVPAQRRIGAGQAVRGPRDHSPPRVTRPDRPHDRLGDVEPLRRRPDHLVAWVTPCSDTASPDGCGKRKTGPEVTLGAGRGCTEMHCNRRSAGHDLGRATHPARQVGLGEPGRGTQRHAASAALIPPPLQCSACPDREQRLPLGPAGLRETGPPAPATSTPPTARAAPTRARLVPG
jgi:hypothetical protein